MAKNKIFVIDTNVILHDYLSIYHFAEHDVVLPIMVLEELDRFKKGSDIIHYHAREFMRELDKLTGEELFTDGVSLGPEKGHLFVSPGKEFTKEMKRSFSEETADHKILAVTSYYHKKFADQDVILVTQDVNFRMKAKSLGIAAQDYKTGKVRNIKKLRKGIETLENVNDDLIAALFADAEGASPEAFGMQADMRSNDYFILKGAKSNALAYFNSETGKLVRVEKKSAYNIKPRNAEQTFSIAALLNPDIQLITLTGKAGTGKTLLALASAIQQRNNYQQILLARPIVPLANRDLGFLPGDAKDKISPYMQPLFDNLSVIKHQFNQGSADYKRIDDMVKNEQLLITPLAYIRGRSLSNVFFIVDEAQNLTPHEVKTIITRAGENTKMIFTGDIQQIDCPYLDSKSNGLSYLADKMKGQNLFAHINLLKGERSHLAELATDLL